jgi:hypothetical protein
MSSRRGAAGWEAAVVALALLGLAGCGGGGPKTYPVRGKVVLADGDVQQLAGSYVEFMLESDSTMRASGTIEPDGSFALQTLHEGKILKGAPEGTYRARIIPSEEDDGSARKRRPKPVHNRFLDFKTSGLSFKVPANGDVTVNVSQR